uniref:Predicted protein n=1 Tax=Hordeum vulgare subsp. vulgare TaxID=112509 RepID=F2DMX6_HORVV|nr:predicted protein [Hordeum vulgare subsp. vulgare]BAK02916.1 predicted protein [Hordeum vulgare subsp. vulgare]
MECLRNITRNNTHGELSLLGAKINETLNKNGTNTSKILFCKSKAKFFHKIY